MHSTPHVTDDILALEDEADDDDEDDAFVIQVWLSKCDRLV